VVDIAEIGPRWSEQLQRVLADRPDRPSLVLLPIDDPRLKDSAARAGAHAVLAYPFSTRDFSDALRRATESAPQGGASDPE